MVLFNVLFFFLKIWGLLWFLVLFYFIIEYGGIFKNIGMFFLNWLINEINKLICWIIFFIYKVEFIYFRLIYILDFCVVLYVFN